MIVIGCGSGRTGTASLSHLINAQADSVCFHELNPSGAVYEGNPQSILNTINEFQRILDGGDKRLLAIDYSRPVSVRTYHELQKVKRLKILGDIAYYYLRYVDDILRVNEKVRFICIKRDRKQTIDSWIQKSTINRWPSMWFADRLKSLITRTPFHKSMNFWQLHDGSTWKLDEVWDKTFPKFDAASKEEAIGKYWDDYYRRAEEFEARYPRCFRIFPIELMSDQRGQAEILDFIGVPKSTMILRERFHSHKSGRRSG